MYKETITIDIDELRRDIEKWKTRKKDTAYGLCLGKRL